MKLAYLLAGFNKRKTLIVFFLIVSGTIASAVFFYMKTLAVPGADWVQATSAAPWEARSGFTLLNYNRKLWLLGGESGPFQTSRNDVWSSVDGVNWIQETAAAAWNPRFGHTSVIFQNKIWVLGGGLGRLQDVWSSGDGINWIQVTGAAPWQGRYGHVSVVFDNKIWVMAGKIGGTVCGGYANDVWSSSDGLNWTQVTGAAPWARRYRPTAFVFNNKMWIVGGLAHDCTTYLNKNDVWSSSDGLNWTQVTGAAPWAARYVHSSVVFNKKMWVMGGYNGSYPRDVWSSADGLNWTQVTAAASWPGRSGSDMSVFNDRIWFVGGRSISTQPYNDVWYSQ